ncbi:hypothetical protein [Mesorhizobium sp. M0276]|uniref:hypothetical protein n=1 Tax=Mesorhizobium sp. M0276 TaxID=2956928 RepID=UPI003337512E
MTAYAAFGKVVHEVGGRGRDYDNANREEERALLAICAYPAATQGDRLAKARYLLEIEARGELDVPDQMQTLLRSNVEGMKPTAVPVSLDQFVRSSPANVFPERLSCTSS